MTQALTVFGAGDMDRPLLVGEKLQLLADTICKGASAGELGMFVEVCNRLRLDPFAKQIHAVKRWDSKLQRETFSFQVGIDGFRLVAQRTGQMDGVEGPYWCGEDGAWVDLWTKPETPFAAKVAVYRKGIARPFIGIAKYESYVATTKDGQPNTMWRKFADAMLAKCAEALALRRAFPAELSGVYSDDEMDQAGPVAAPAAQIARPQSKSKTNPPPAPDAGAAQPQPTAQPSASPAPQPASAPASPEKRNAVVRVVQRNNKSWQDPEKDADGKFKKPAKKYVLWNLTENGNPIEATTWETPLTDEVAKAMEGALDCSVTISTNAKGQQRIVEAKAQEPGGDVEAPADESAVA